MAHVIAQQPHQVSFPHRPVNHAPSPLGFGFGLSPQAVNSGWPAPSLQRATTGMPTMSGHSPQTRVSKRRYEHDDDDSTQRQPSDDAMDRSPTPERPKRAAPKRARTIPAALAQSKDPKTGAQSGSSQTDGNDVDVGVLLASLPRESLLPVLTSLILAQPSLKSTVLSLIPRPTLETATQAVEKSAKRLLDAFPYSNTQFNGFAFSSSGFGQGRISAFGEGGGFGFARPASGSSHPPEHTHPAGMREEYVLSRIRPHVQDFISACFSYLPYFSYCEPMSLSEHSPRPAPHVQSHASALQTQHKDKSHPSETYLFLQTLTTHAISQPPLTQSALLPLLLPRLVTEWKAWVDRVDQVVNREGGMFGQETVRSWERGLDDLAQAKGHGLEVLRDVRDQWVSRVGWLVGRQRMEEL